MRLLVTGANGFLGRHVVTEVRRRGHDVRALVRPKSDATALGDVECVRADLRDRDGLTDAVAGCDAVLHLAAAKSGDLYGQMASTVVATENLLHAMDVAGVDHLVLVSSFSVYDYRVLPAWRELDETSPLEQHPEQRDEYCRTKLIQERIARDFAADRAWRLAVLRPGVIYGPENLWTARLGAKLGDRRWLRIGAWAPLPLTYVESCAEAIVMAAVDDRAAGETFNVVDETPSQRLYASLVRRRLSPRPSIVPVPWTAVRLVAWLGQLTNTIVFGGTAKVPGLFVPARLHARCKPLRYSNRKLRAVLGWTPRYSLEEALDRSVRPPAKEEGPPPETPSPLYPSTALPLSS